MEIDLSELLDYLEDAHDYETYIAARCVFHDDNRPSLMIHPDTYKCWACGAWGKTEDLLAKLEGKVVFHAKTDFHNPWTKWLKNDPLVKVLINSWTLLKQNPSIGSYLRNRGIDNATTTKLGIGYRDNWFTFPIKNHDGEVIGAVARAGDGNTSSSKYVVPSGQDPNLLYIPSWARVDKCNQLYVTFGIIDAIAIYLCGHAAASTLSGKRLDPQALKPFRKEIIFVPDDGEVIEAKRIASHLGWRGKVLDLKYEYPFKDPSDLWSAGLLGEKL